jgi:serine/threonine-protein kinase PknK
MFWIRNPVAAEVPFRVASVAVHAVRAMIDPSPPRPPAEHSLPSFGASIQRSTSPATRLARACREASSAPPEDAIGVVLRHLREAAGAERAFLLDGARPSGPPRVLAASASGREDAAVFSTSVARRALLGERPLFVADVTQDPVWADGDSVRALCLRSALAAPLPSVDGRRSAIVLDSRAPLSVGAEEGCELVLAFAGLISLLRRAAPVELRPTRRLAPAPVGNSPAFVLLQGEIRAAAQVPLPALVVGESGTGKELVARALHEQGSRARRPFVAINCAAIPEALLERELFGATRGSFTGADRDHPGLFRQAEGGTVFLDEIGDMPLTLQAKLLRVLQESSVRAVGALEERAIDVRLVAATHRELRTLVADDRFRADLRWRLEVLVLRVPPLRDRADDLPILSERLLERLVARCALPDTSLAKDALERLRTHAWPGNIRELESVLARALLRARGGVIRAGDLDIADAPETDRDDSPAGGLERAMIEQALRAARGNMTAAALKIGWSRQALYRRIHALGLHDDRPRAEESDPQDSSACGGTRSSDSSTFQ